MGYDVPRLQPFGTVGIATVAISAVDLALWDLAGKLQQKPVYQLIGGPARERIFTYATGDDVDWYRELGFRAFKLPASTALPTACGPRPKRAAGRRSPRVNRR